VGIWPGTGTVYSGSDKENDDENDDDDRDLPTIEKLLFTKLQEQGFAAADPNPGHIERGVEEAVADERAGSIDHHGSALGDNSGGSTGERAHYTVCRGDGRPVFLTRCRRSNCPTGRWRLACLRSRSQ
jgi:hypothetical protein